MLGGALQVLWLEPRMLCNAGEHPWSDFVPVMESEDEVLPLAATQDLVRTFLARNRPAKPQQSSENQARARRRPVRHRISSGGERHVSDSRCIHLAGVDLIGKNAEGKGTSRLGGVIWGIAVGEHTG